MATDLRKIIVSISTGADVPDLKVNRIILTNEVGGLPIAHLFTQPKASSSAKVSSTKLDWNAITDITADMQDASFKVVARDAPEGDITVEISEMSIGGINDGEGTHLIFSGFMTAPGFLIMPGSVNNPFQVLHKDIQLQAFDPAIYNSSFVGSETEQAGGGGVKDEIGQIMSQPIATTISLMLSYVLGSLPLAPGLAGPPAPAPAKPPKLKRAVEGMSDDALQARHETNLLHVDRVFAFLDRSTDTVMQVGGPSSDYSLAKSAALESGLLGEIVSNIFSAHNFGRSAMGQLLDSFLFQFVADFDGGAKIEHLQCLAEIEDVIIQAPIASIEFNLSGVNHLPLGQVICQTYANIRRPERSTNTANATTNTHILEEVVGRYPKVANPEGGRVYSIPAPNFLTIDFINKQVGYAEDSSTGKRDAEGHVKKSKADIEEQATDVSSRLVRFLDVWCEKWYQRLVLHGAMATIKIPLDLRYGAISRPLGRVYGVEALGESEGPKHLFSGYLQTVSHEIAVLPAGQSQAYTTLVFNHVKSIGFELPTASTA